MSHLHFGYAFVVISWGKRFLVGIIRGLVAFGHYLLCCLGVCGDKRMVRMACCWKACSDESKLCQSVPIK